VGGEDVGGFGFEQEVAEDFVAEVAGGFFNGLAAGFGDRGGIYGLEVERDVEGDAEIGDEGLVGIGFRTAEGVVDVDGGEADAERVAGEGVGGVEQAKKGR
jgi:hypothetical protein